MLTGYVRYLKDKTSEIYEDLKNIFVEYLYKQNDTAYFLKLYSLYLNRK